MWKMGKLLIGPPPHIGVGSTTKSVVLTQIFSGGDPWSTTWHCFRKTDWEAILQEAKKKKEFMDTMLIFKIKFGVGYNLYQNAEDKDSSFNILDGEVSNSVFDFAGTASPYLDTTSYVLTSGEELQPGTSSSKEVMIVYPGADMHTLDTHQDCQNSNPSNKNKVPRRKSTFFTIEEDEALVQGVLKHGTGRWKMIKDEAFGNDSRRTHTDLRDKWRSLVKTANLPAHKRRGVVPPEELLEMVRHVDQMACKSHQQAMHAAP